MVFYCLWIKDCTQKAVSFPVLNVKLACAKAKDSAENTTLFLPVSQENFIFIYIYSWAEIVVAT